MTSVTYSPSINAFNGVRTDTVPAHEENISQYDDLNGHINAQNIRTICITTSNGSIIYLALERIFKSNAARRRFKAILKTILYHSKEESMRCKTCIMGFIR